MYPIERIEGIQFVRLPVRLTLAGAATLKKFLQSELLVGEPCVAFDLSAVELADSSGLSALLAGIGVVQERGGQAILLSPRARVRALIELTRLHEVAAIVDDRAELLGTQRSRALS